MMREVLVRHPAACTKRHAQTHTVSHTHTHTHTHTHAHKRGCKLQCSGLVCAQTRSAWPTVRDASRWGWGGVTCEHRACGERQAAGARRAVARPLTSHSRNKIATGPPGVASFPESWRPRGRRRCVRSGVLRRQQQPQALSLHFAGACVRLPPSLPLPLRATAFARRRSQAQCSGCLRHPVRKHAVRRRRQHHY
jgi:hypothetical protein